MATAQCAITSRFTRDGDLLRAEGVKIIPLIEPWLEPSDPYYAMTTSNLDFIKDNNGNTFKPDSTSTAMFRGSTGPVARARPGGKPIS